MPTNNNTPEIHVTPTDIKGNEVVRISRLNDQGQWEHCFSMFSDLKDYFGAGLEFIPENVANKATDLSSDDNTHYPTTQAVKTYVDTAVVGLLNDRGNYDASVNAFPSTGGSGTAGAIMKGDLWYISVAGNLGGTNVLPGYSIRALVDNPTTAANWDILNVGFGYVPENAANKDTDGTLTANSDTRYASQKATKTYVDTGLSGKLNTTDTTDAVTEGTTNKYFTTARVLATALTGYAAAGSRVAVAATDTVLQAFGKVGKYLSDLATVAFTGSYSDLTGTPTALPPNGSAGGDLTGTYPNPTIKTNVALGGNPTTTTQTTGDNSTKIATTAFVHTAVADSTPSLASMQIGYGDGGNLLTGDASFVRIPAIGIAIEDHFRGGNIFIGDASLNGAAGNGSIAGNSNVVLGGGAGIDLSTGSFNTIIGALSGGSNSSGTYMSILGANSNTSDGLTMSTVIGANSGSSMSNQIVFGTATEVNWQIAGIDYVMPSSNGAGTLTNDGSGNLSWGSGEGTVYTSQQIPFGDGTTPGGITSPNLTWDGVALNIYDNTSNYNTFIGSAGLIGNNTTTGWYNIFIGSFQAQGLASGWGNTSVGEDAFVNISDGFGNTGLGKGAGTSITTDSNLTILGYSAETDTLGVYNMSTALGAQSQITMSNQMVFGTSSEVNWKIAGVDYIMPSAGAAGVLTNDGSGNLSWGGGSTGTGVSLVADADLMGETASNTIVTYTPSADGNYRIGGYVNVLAISGALINLIVNFTDENGAATQRNILLSPSGASPDAQDVASAIFNYGGIDTQLRAQAGSPITISTIVAFGTATFDVGATIEFLGGSGSGGGSALIGQTNGLASSPTPGGTSEVFLGYRAGAGGGNTDATVFIGSSDMSGAGAGEEATNAAGSVFIGGGVSAASATGAYATNAYMSVFIGEYTGVFCANAFQSQFIGACVGAGSATNANNSQFIGCNTAHGAANANNSIFIGDSSGNGDAVNNQAQAAYSGLSGSYTVGETVNCGGGQGIVVSDTGAILFITSALGTINPGDTMTGLSSGATAIIDSFIPIGHSILLGDNTSTGGFSNSIAIGTAATNTQSNEFLVAAAYTNWNIAGVPYVMPTTQGANGDVLVNDGSGGLTWNAGVPSGSPFLASTQIGYGDGSNLLTGDANFIYVTGQGIGLQDSNGSIYIGAGSFLAGNASGNGIAGIGIGGGALSNIGSGANNNIAIGTYAMSGLVSGSHNIGIGENAGNTNITGSQLTLLGDNSQVNADGYVMSTAIGANSAITMNNQFVFGTATEVNWQIAGVDYVMPSSGAVGALTNDGSGNLSWQSSSGVVASADLTSVNTSTTVLTYVNPDSVNAHTYAVGIYITHIASGDPNVSMTYVDQNGNTQTLLITGAGVGAANTVGATIEVGNSLQPQPNGHIPTFNIRLGASQTFQFDINPTGSCDVGVSLTLIS